MDGRLNVRLATHDDDPALLALDVGEPGAGFPSVDCRERTSFFGQADPSATIVAGFEGFAVAPQRQGAGVGRARLDHARATARRRGGAKLSLRVLSTNPRAIALYEAAGFTVGGVLAAEFVIDGERVDDLLMAVTL